MVATQSKKFTLPDWAKIESVLEGHSLDREPIVRQWLSECDGDHLLGWLEDQASKDAAKAYDDGDYEKMNDRASAAAFYAGARKRLESAGLAI